MPNRVLGGIFLTIAASIWGGMFVAVKLVVDIIPPIPLVWFRYLVAFVVLSMVVIYEGINLKIDKKEDGTFTYTPQVVESRELDILFLLLLKNMEQCILQHRWVQLLLQRHQHLC